MEIEETTRHFSDDIIKLKEEVKEFVYLDKSDPLVSSFEEMIQKLEALGLDISFEHQTRFYYENKSVYIIADFDGDGKYKLWIKNPEFEKTKHDMWLKWCDDNDCGERAVKELAARKNEKS